MAVANLYRGCLNRSNMLFSSGDVIIINDFEPDFYFIWLTNDSVAPTKPKRMLLNTIHRNNKIHRYLHESKPMSLQDRPPMRPCPPATMSVHRRIRWKMHFQWLCPGMCPAMVDACEYNRENRLHRNNRSEKKQMKIKFPLSQTNGGKSFI